MSFFLTRAPDAGAAATAETDANAGTLWGIDTSTATVVYRDVDLLYIGGPPTYNLPTEPPDSFVMAVRSSVDSPGALFAESGCPAAECAAIDTGNALQP